jgi:intein-encoded DNA endonuclease-like protein
MQRSLDQDFFKKWSAKMAYVLGFFAADGSMITNKRGGHFIEFMITDRIVLEHIQRVTGSNHKIAVRKRQFPWKIAYRIQIGSKEWFADLEKLGFTQNKSKSLRVPNIPGKYFSDFVRGYFDGDGNVYFKKHKVKMRKNKRWIFSSRFTSGSRKYLEELHALLLKRGIQKGFILSKSKNSGFELVLSHFDSLALYRLMYHTIPATDLYLPRKRLLFKKAIKTLYPMRV